MRQLSHPKAVARATDWLESTMRSAFELRRAAARSAALAGRRRSLLVEDFLYFAQLLSGTVAWLEGALPPGARSLADRSSMSAEERTLRRLGLGAEDVRRDEVMARHFLRVLEASDWNLTVAARVLGVSRRTLDRFTAEKAARR